MCVINNAIPYEPIKCRVSTPVLQCEGKHRCFEETGSSESEAWSPICALGWFDRPINRFDWFSVLARTANRYLVSWSQLTRWIKR